ncbi:hypothetical protein, partial [Xanthomonas maliensis]
CISRSRLTSHLGVHQPLAPQTIDEGAYISAKIAYPGSGASYPSANQAAWQRRQNQAIGWYGQIATQLQAIA